MTEQEHTQAIARLNDQHRALSGQGWVMTSGVQDLGTLAMVQAVAAVAAFSDFGEDNDPMANATSGRSRSRASDCSGRSTTTI